MVAVSADPPDVMVMSGLWGGGIAPITVDPGTVLAQLAIHCRLSLA